MALTSFNFPAPQIIYSPQPLYRPAFPSAPIPAGPDPNTIKKKLSLMNSVKAGSFLAVQTVGLGSLIGLAVDLIRPGGYQRFKKALVKPKLPMYLLAGAASVVLTGVEIGSIMGGTMAHFAKKKLLKANSAFNNQSQDPQKPPTVLNPQAVLKKAAVWALGILLSLRLGMMFLTAKVTKQPLTQLLKAFKNPRIAIAETLILLWSTVAYAWTAKRISSWMRQQVGMQPTSN